MITAFTIKNFRRFERLTIDTIGRVNLIAGQNDTGKTALLEALWLHAGPNVPELGFRLAGFRGIPEQDFRRFLHDLFYNFEFERTISLSAMVDLNDGKANGLAAAGQRNLEITTMPVSSVDISDSRLAMPHLLPPSSQEADVSAASNYAIVLNYTDEHGKDFTSRAWMERNVNQVPPLFASLPGTAIESVRMVEQRANMPPLPSSIFLSARTRSRPEEELTRFGEAEMEGMADRIVACLQAVDPRIKQLKTIATSPMPMLYADVGLSRLTPLGLMGDGIGRLLSMVLAFYGARNGSIMIDEIENGLHYSALAEVWQHIHWLSREFNVQVFATTHSYECLAAARNAFQTGNSSDLLVHRLDLGESGINPVTVPYENLDFILASGFEVR